MIRILILADSATRAHRLAEIFAEDSDIEVLHAGTVRANEDHEPVFADVVVYAGLDSTAIDTIATPVVVLAKAGDAPRWAASIRAWLGLDADSDELLAAVRAAAQNLTALTQTQAARWLPTRSAQEQPQLSTFEEQLTPRELQVLRMLANGLGNKEVASALGISEHTAKAHVGQILAKLGAVSRAEAVALGIRRGLVPL